MYDFSSVILANTIFYLALSIFGAAAITSFVPKRLYNPENFLFKEKSFEQGFYKALRINIWKDKLPIYRHNDKMFDRKRMSEKISKEYLETFISETCKAEFVHLAILMFGLCSLVFVLIKLEPLIVFIIVNIVMMLIHLPFVFIQRHNRRRLIKLYRRVKLKEGQLCH